MEEKNLMHKSDRRKSKIFHIFLYVVRNIRESSRMVSIITPTELAITVIRIFEAVLSGTALHEHDFTKFTVN
jgi:hypothetical protein